MQPLACPRTTRNKKIKKKLKKRHFRQDVGGDNFRGKKFSALSCLESASWAMPWQDAAHRPPRQQQMPVGAGLPQAQTLLMLPMDLLWAHHEQWLPLHIPPPGFLCSLHLQPLTLMSLTCRWHCNLRRNDIFDVHYLKSWFIYLGVGGGRRGIWGNLKSSRKCLRINTLLDRIKGVLPTKMQSGQAQVNAEIGVGGTTWAEKELGELD